MTADKADQSKKPTIKIGSQRSEDEIPKPAKPAEPSAGETPAASEATTSAEGTVANDAATASETTAAPVEPTDSPQSNAPANPNIPSAEELFPASIVDQMTGDLEDEINNALGDLSLDDLMANESSASSGGSTQVELDQRYPARVIKVDRDSIFFSFGGAHEGLAAKRIFDEIPEPGAELEVIPTRFLNDDNLYELVVPGASMDVQDWSDLSEGVVVEVNVTGHNKGGLECEVKSIRGFMPISHIALYRVDDLEQFVGQTMRCVVTEANEQRGNLVLSARAVLEREREAAKEKLMEELEVGQIREGTVTRLQDFGAFVDLGGIDGLIHVSQLSWDRVKHPSEVIEEGQKVKVRVDKIDAAAGRIGLSYRDLLEDPWEDAESEYAVGTVHSGRVTKLMEFGAFVRLAAGVEGLVHISEIAHHRVHRVNTVLSEDQEVTVKVLQCDRDAQRISLSIKAAVEKAAPETNDEAAEADDEPRREMPKVNVPLKGGLNRPSGGEDIGLKW